MLIKTHDFSAEELAQFQSLQRLSFSILENMAAELKPGITEKEVAHELVKRYRAAGTDSFFHLPVVLFGERTALPGKWRTGHFFPRSRKLEEGDSVILDASPLFKGYLVDTSYSFCIGENALHQEMMLNLAQFRSQILDAVNQGETFSAIAETVNVDIKGMSYEPVHEKHPGEVLGHRAVKTINLPFSPRFQGFDALTLSWFGLKGRLVDLGLSKKLPLWNTSKGSNHKAHDGLWLVEPHAGKGEVGAKWEEILVIENGRARWLDDNPPHLLQWQQIREGKNYGPLVSR